MELKRAEAEVLDEYLSHHAPLVGDRRTGQAFEGTVRGIMGAESLVCAWIASDPLPATIIYGLDSGFDDKAVWSTI